MIKTTMAALSFLALLAAGRLGAAEYFVSKQGSDTNNGLSRATAFATIQKGVDILQSGDTLTILPGEYFGSVRRDGLGTNGIITTIRAEIPGTAVLRGDVPVTGFRKVENTRFTYMADMVHTGKVVAVNELDTLKILERAPNIAELDFRPGVYYHDTSTAKLYISTPDIQPPDSHHYTASLIGTHGCFLSNPRRVIIEGLAVTGFNAAEMIDGHDGTLNSVFGIFMNLPLECVIRDCRAYLNGQGIGLNSDLGRDRDTGDNLIERCTAWGNHSHFNSGTCGGISIFGAKRDIIRDSAAFLNGAYGVTIYGGGDESKKEQYRSRLINILAWGNGLADLKIKTGAGDDGVHTTESSVALVPSNDYDPSRCLLGKADQREVSSNSNNNIVLDREQTLDPDAEFADPENLDYHLQSGSRFRKSAPDGSDRGPFPYENNIFYVRPDGNDGADGLSVSNAWKTLSRASRDLRSGDTLYLAPGNYEGALQLTLQGTKEKPIAIRGRGRSPAVIRDGLGISGGKYLKFERLHIGSPVKIIKGEDIAFANCLFTAGATSLEAAGAVKLGINHCAFTGFKHSALALKGCSEIYLSGNIYDNYNCVALRLDAADAIKYSNYNSYRDASGFWEAGGKPLDLSQARKIHDQQSLSLIPEFAEENGTIILKNPLVFATFGPMGRPIGPHFDEKRRDSLRLVTKPEVHSIGTTTADIEWMTSLPATCVLGWGETSACTNRLDYDVNRFGAFSLTGLKPGQAYFFRVMSLRMPEEIARGTEGDESFENKPVEPEGDPLSFTTLKEKAAPVTYYVAPDGNDTNSGLSRPCAWKTIQRAANQANPGDTVTITGGKYPECVRIRATGESNAPVTFKCMPGEKAILFGAGKTLSQGFVASGKDHLRFDGIYFSDFNRQPLWGWLPAMSGEFNLYHCRDIRITRCFSDGRGTYTARFVIAWDLADLAIQNCVTMNKMSGAMWLKHCANLEFANNVIARPMITSFILQNKPGQAAIVKNNIFTDMLKKKADANLPLLYTTDFDGLRMPDNCIFVRSFPPDKRTLMPGYGGVAGERVKNAKREESVIINPLFTDPLFAGDPDPANTAGFPPDRMMNSNLKLDFDSFFATNPELVKRSIGLRPEAFKEFDFKRNRDENIEVNRETK